MITIFKTRPYEPDDSYNDDPIEVRRLIEHQYWIADSKLNVEEVTKNDEYCYEEVTDVQSSKFSRFAVNKLLRYGSRTPVLAVRVLLFELPE